MKIFSFSLWGNNPIYTEGCVKNISLINRYLPDWHSWVFCSTNTNQQLLNRLAMFQNIHIVNCPAIEIDDCSGMFWRFIPISSSNFEYVAIRDTDSRISPREIYAIKDWIESDADVHIMRDHPYHGVPILGGMWGIKGGKYQLIKNDIVDFKPTSKKGQDQEFLKHYLYSKVEKGELRAKVHDPFFEGIPFPIQSKRGKENNGIDFIGQCFMPNDTPNSLHDKAMLYNAVS